MSFVLAGKIAERKEGCCLLRCRICV